MKEGELVMRFLNWESADCSRYKNLLSLRAGETRIGEQLVPVDSADVVILGVAESIGPRVNHGNSGAENGFDAFCAKFLNMQVNNYVPDAKVAILGVITVDNQETPASSDVEKLDEFVLGILNQYVRLDQRVILIGGGHNNALPLINWVSNSHCCKINVVNLDPHADYRALEGRHSGNPFSYAFQQGLLNQYWVLGLHQAYNNAYILNALEHDGHAYAFFEDWLDQPESLLIDIRKTFAQLLASGIPYGIELDLDAIKNMPSSACSPSGVSVENARRYVRIMARSANCKYLHLPEAAPKTTQERNQVGKTLAYLVLDFISCHPFG